MSETNRRETMANGIDLMLWGHGHDSLAREAAGAFPRGADAVDAIEASAAGPAVWFDPPEGAHDELRRIRAPEGWAIEHVDQFADGVVCVTIVPEGSDR